MRLRAEPVAVRLLPDEEGHGPTAMLGFNGRTPGPEIRAVEGGRVSVAFENGIGQPSAVHWHGIHIDNAMDGVPGLTQEAVAPGATFEYDFAAPYPGTYWYHAHHRSWEQVAQGLYGPLIVEERAPPKVDRDITVVLDDWRLTPGRRASSELRQPARFLPCRQARQLRARVLLARQGAEGRPGAAQADQRGDRADLPRQDRRRRRRRRGAGRDAARRPEPLGEPVLAPAQRTDIVLDVAGPVTFHLLPRGEPYPLGTVAVEGSNPAPARGPVEPLPPTAVPAPDANGARRLTLAMQGGAMGGRHGGEDFWAFNDRSGMPDAPWQRFARGETARITMRNDTAFPHGIHIHGHHFRELGADGSLGHYRDTTLVDPRKSRDVLCVFDNPGRWLIHCHTLAHQASGMKTWVEVA